MVGYLDLDPGRAKGRRDAAQRTREAAR